MAPASSLASATTPQTHKTPGSMSEWRMMQMQLQQQDDLHFALPVSLTIPPVSSHSRHHYGLPPTAAAAGSAAVSISSSSACSCLRCCSVPSPSDPLAALSPDAAAASAPVAGTHSRADDAGTVTQHHSFLLHPHSPNHVLSAAAAVAAGRGADRDVDDQPETLPTRPVQATTYSQHHPNHSFFLQQHPLAHPHPHPHPLPQSLPQSLPHPPSHSPSQQPHPHPIHPLYSHANISSASSDYFSSRDIHPPYHGLGNATLGGSTATLNSDCPPSSVDPLDFDHPYTHGYSCTHHPNGSNGCSGQCSSANDASVGTFLNYPYLRPAPASAVGGSRPKHCRNCPQRQSRRPSLGAAGSGLASPVMSTTTTAAFSPTMLGGAEMEQSASGTSFTGSLHSCSNAVRRQSSPSLGPFRSLSSKIAATTIKKLSGSQKSLFGTSRDDLLSAGCQCCQESAEWGSNPGSGGCCCCSRGRGGTGGSGCGGSGGEGTWATNNNSGSGGNKVQRMQSKLNSLRGGNGRNHSKDRGSKGSRKSPGDMDYSHSSQYVTQEFAQYNYERQMEDFQRAARVFKEQKALTSAAAAASIAAETRAAVKEAAAAAAAAAAAEAGRSKRSEITPIDESEEGNGTSPTDQSQPLSPCRSLGSLTEGPQNGGNSNKDASDALRAPSPKPRKKSLAPSSRSSLFNSGVRPPRRTGSTSGSITSGKASQRINCGGNVGGYGSRTNSIRRTDNNVYPEMGQTGMGMGADLRLSGLGIGLGIGSGFGLDSMGFDSYSTGANNASNTDLRSGSIDSYGRGGYASAYDDIPMLDMAPSSMHPLRTHPSRYEEVQSLKGRLSSISQDTRAGAGGFGGSILRSAGTMRTDRSVHSVYSVDTVSQQIAARHHQHSRLAMSNIASLHSQSAAMHSNCETIGATAGGDGARRGPGCPRSNGGIVLENSPIQVVRATVGTVDDSSLPCFTFRMWVLSTVFVIMGAAISEYNFFRANSAYFSIYFVQLASYFLGKAMARWLPTREFEIWIPRWSCTPTPESDNNGNRTMSTAGRKSDCSADEIEVDNCSEHHQGTGGGDMAEEAIHQTERSERALSNAASIKVGLQSIIGASASQRWISKRFTLNPGKFNMKEHMLIGIAAAAGCSPAYATNVLAIQSLIFNAPLGSLTGVGLVVSSQCIGFSMAWFLFDYVIKPSVMIWPATLVNVSLYNTLHEHKVLTRWFTRMQLFWYAFFAIFIYQWLPRMFMPVLTSMALLCWIKPSNNILRKLGSGYTGLGMGCISLDWSIIGGVGPLYTPWWAQCNFFVGLIAMLWVVTPIVYFTNYWSAMSYPIVSSNLYDRNAQLYDISRIVNSDLTFNITMYKNYSPVIMTPYFAITYGTSFMAVIATFVHVALFYGADIWLISSTRFERKMRQIRHPGFVVSIVRAIWGADPEPVAEQQQQQQQQHGTASEIYMSEYGYGFAGTDGMPTRRNSEALSFMNSGMSIAGADDRSGLYQPSYYRRMSQQQQQQQQQQQPSGFIPAMAQTPTACKQPVDERAQIPTEMFGTEDIHTSLMREYPEIPGWWFGVLFLVCFMMAVLVCKTSEIRLPVYALVLALMLAAVFALPMAIIQAISSSQIGLNVLSEVVCGYLLPGNQLGNSVFKCYSYMALYQCLNLTQGFKLGHYMKVPPRHIFIVVLYGTLVGAFVNLQVLDWVLVYNRQELFEADPKSGWSFRNIDLFFSASLLWGAISPVRLFEEGSIYHFLPYCFLIGVLLPIPCYLLYRHYPPYGAMCKGSSVFPFLPKCTCPAAHPSSASSSPQTDISGPTAVHGSPSHHSEDRVVSGQAGGDDLHLEAARQCWPFSQRRPSSNTRLKEDSRDDKSGLDGALAASSPTSVAPAPAPAPALAPSTASASAGVTRKQPDPPAEAHLYYGNPDRWLEGRLRRMPWHLVNTPLICVGASFVPQAPASFVVSAGVVAFCFAFLVLRYRHEWWRRYTYVLAAALDAGTQICNMAIFVVFALILKGAVGFPSWFGNDAVNPEKCGLGDGYN